LFNNVTGIDNTGLGNFAGAGNYHGSNNTSIGSFAMQNSTGDGFNTAVGMQAMINTTSGSNNTAIGYNSLLTNTLGSKNTALGSLANVAASSNATAIGYGAIVSSSNTIQLGADGMNGITAGAVTYPNFDGLAGQVLTTTGGGTLYWRNPGVPYTGATGAVNLGGYDLTVNGIKVGRGGGNVLDNTVIGLGALYSNTTGQGNTANGAGALATNTEGSYNTANGVNALLSNTTGSFNTAIGLGAGDFNTSGTNNTFIGNGAMGSTPTANDEITLGDFAITALRAQVTSITSLSDRRDKTDIITISEGLDFLKQLKPVSFTWNTRDKAKVGIKSAGFIAQDLLALQQKSTIGANLDLVSQQNPDKFEARYSNLLPVIVKAIQEESTQKDNEIAALKAFNQDQQKVNQDQQKVNQAQQKQIEELKLLILSMKK
jgi:hypothetical protein